jgi:hypothetical protein
MPLPQQLERYPLDFTAACASLAGRRYMFRPVPRPEKRQGGTPLLSRAGPESRGPPGVLTMPAAESRIPIYRTAMVTVFEVTPPMEIVTGTPSPGGALNTRALTW